MTSSPINTPALRATASPAPSSRSSVEKADAPTASIPTAYVSDKADDSSKLRTFLSILRKFIGVADIASVRFSLPAQLLEPIPNLEYWNYLDRPETFISTEHRTVRVSYITEQTSHHPPVSAFWVDCPVKGISAYGFDQLSAKFTGTSVRVTPGAHNLGIFINLKHRDNEEYRLTHPAAQLAGMLRGSLSITVADICYITCPKSKTKVILHYLEEGWLGKAQNRVHGVVFHYDPDNDNTTKIKDIPEKDVLARLEGCWQDKVHYTLKDSKVHEIVWVMHQQRLTVLEQESQLLIDLNPLWPISKIIPPENQQLSTESRRFWHGVTDAIINKQYGQATRLKQELEERQREKATERKDQDFEWRPRFFTEALMTNGKPLLTEDGRMALQRLQEGNYHLEESANVGT
ncbi:MAG: hypothetical protein LQ348_000015 [Seirophora lacunosa]|nr:MAG: hypothetical protein LQ348_000015 [Seirophora lacunosa]